MIMKEPQWPGVVVLVCSPRVDIWAKGRAFQTRGFTPNRSISNLTTEATYSSARQTTQPGAFGQSLASGRLPLAVGLYLAAVLMPVLFNIGSLVLTPIRLMLLLYVPILTVQLFSGRFGKVLAVDIFFYLYLVWATIAIAVNNPDKVVESIGSTTVEFLGGYLIARAYIRTPESYESLIRTLMVITILLLPFTIPELLNGKAVIPNLIDSIPGLRSVNDGANPKRMGLERVQNVFAHAIHYGLYSSIPFISVLYGMKDRKSLAWRLVGAATIGFAVFASLSSGALLALLLQTALLAWALVLTKFRYKWLLLFGLFVLVYILIDLLSNRTPVRVFMTYATFSAQTAFYRSGINDWGWFNVGQNPVFGLGLRDWIRPAFMMRGSVDNFWLVSAMRYGIPGLVLLSIGCLAGIVQVAKRDTSASAHITRLRVTWVITYCGIAFTLATVHVWTNVFSFVFFFFGAGMWIASYNAASDAAADSPPLASARGKQNLQRPPVAAPSGPVRLTRFARNWQKDAPVREPSPPASGSPYARPSLTEKPRDRGARSGRKPKA